MKTCAVCGSQFRDTTRNQTKLYCSISCRKRAERDRYIREHGHARPAPKRAGGTCLHCGATIFRQNRGGDARKFCSRECSYAHASSRAAKRWACSLCGEPLNKKARDRRLSTCWTCRKQLRHERKAAARVRRCQCGAPLERYRHLCPACRDERKTARRKASGRTHKCNHRKRAREYGVPYQPGISWRTAVARFGAVCGICGDPIDVTVKHPALDSPTLDHIVPMSRGGSHTWDNVQPAHLYCNSVKCDRDMDAVRCA